MSGYLSRKAAGSQRRSELSFSKTRKMRGQGPRRMKERVREIKKSKRRGKKYMAIIENLATRKRRVVHFGGLGYQQYKDRTRRGLYSQHDHGSRKRMRSYFSRHSGTPNRKRAIAKEIRKSRGYYNAKILSHIYLW
jgi:hypothetical protein